MKLPFYERKGDKNGYLGYPYTHSLRYKFSYSDYFQVGLVGAQDAGEPFFANRNALGYDHYSFYVAVRKLGRIKSAVAGRYKVRFGQGLVINNDFSFGKTMSLLSQGRSYTTIRPHSSHSQANYLQGGAATVALTRHIDLSAFASYRKNDATLNDDGTIRTLLKSGYHRTPTEMEKKKQHFANYFRRQFAMGKLWLSCRSDGIVHTVRPPTDAQYCANLPYRLSTGLRFLECWRELRLREPTMECER